MSNTMVAGRGTEKLTVSNSSVGFAAIPTGAQRAYIYVDVDDIYFENDGTAADSNSLPVLAGSYINLTDHLYLLSALRFIRKTTDATLYISYEN